jgi:hypothetical protein
MASMGWSVMKWKGCGMKWLWPSLRFCPAFCGGTKENRRSHDQDSLQAEIWTRDYSSTKQDWNIVAAGSSETLVTFYQTTWLHILEGNILPGERLVVAWNFWIASGLVVSASLRVSAVVHGPVRLCFQKVPPSATGSSCHVERYWTHIWELPADGVSQLLVDMLHSTDTSLKVQ